MTLKGTNTSKSDFFLQYKVFRDFFFLVFVVQCLDALDTVRAVRRDACPNYGFFSQLQAFEKKKLGSISIEMNEYIQNVLLEPFELSLDAIDRAIVGSHGDVGKALMTLTTAYMNDLK